MFPPSSVPLLVFLSSPSMPCSTPFFLFFFFLMIRRPPRSTLDRSSAASDVYKRQVQTGDRHQMGDAGIVEPLPPARRYRRLIADHQRNQHAADPVSYTHLRAHETVLDLVCRLLLEKKKNTQNKTRSYQYAYTRCTRTSRTADVYSETAAYITDKEQDTLS